MMPRISGLWDNAFFAEVLKILNDICSGIACAAKFGQVGAWLMIIPSSSVISEFTAVFGIAPQPSAIRAALKTPGRDGTPGYLPTFVELMKKPAELFDRLELQKNFDTAVGWCKAFHILEPLLDTVAVGLLCDRLEHVGCSPDKEKILDGIKEVDIHSCLVSCSCNMYMHYATCRHSVAWAYKHKLLKSYPANLDPTKMQETKRGRPHKAVGGKPLGPK
jgi:hypothetical protein